MAAFLFAPLPALAQPLPPSTPFEPARLVRSVLPKAPPMAPAQRVDVVLTLDVDARGRVVAVTVTTSGGAPFDAAATAAARRFVFSPARLDGQPVPVQVTYRSHFLGAKPTAAPDGGHLAQPLIGQVRSRGDRVPQAGIHVLVDDGAQQAVTDANGHFAVDGLSAGEHVVHLRGIDMTPADETVWLRLDWPTMLTAYVDVKPRYVSHVHTRAALSDSIEQTISSEEIRHIAGTQGDALKAVQNLPGVARPPFNGGLIAVWGSPPGDTRVYTDGVYIPTLYHFGGIRSTVNASLVQSLTLLPGGYDVEHGRGLGGVVEIETREPRNDGFHGFAQADLVDVSGMLEGGIGRNFSFAGGFRVSWIEFFIEALAAKGDPGRLAPKYWDYQLKLHFRASARDTVDLFFFGSNDTLTLWVQPTEGLAHQFVQHTFYHRALFRWRHRFAGGATLTVTPSVGYDVPYGLDVTFGNAKYSHTDAQLGYSLRALYRLPLGRRLRIDAGVDYEGTRGTLDARQNLEGLFREGDTGDLLGYTAPDRVEGVATDHLAVYTNHVAPFLALTIALFHQRLLVMPQLRVETMTFLGHPGTPERFASSWVLPEPRLATRVRVSSRVVLQASVGLYHQAPLSADFSTVFGNPALSPEAGIHYVAGVEVELTPTLHAEAQGFYKDLRNLVVRGASAAEPPLVNGGVGRVYGGELLLRQQLWHNFFGWISYTLSRSERRDHPGDPWRPFEYDQTHILTLLGSYKLPLGFQVGLRFRYVTGNPYTPVASAYYDVNTASYVPFYAAPYSGRLPAFNQLDLRVDKTFAFNHWRLIAYLDVQNVYDATSAEGVTYSYDFKQTRYLNGLPFLPVLGLRGEF